ncbi:hypothetical protein HanHA300_Chr02g0061701 [Helianthus annuus]|nr:hypothetical protein HanHA300_Chr02g0061701 [Helianthus annuus]
MPPGPVNLLTLRVSPLDLLWPPLFANALPALYVPKWKITPSSVVAVDDLRRENERLKNDLKISQTIAADLWCQVVEAERKLQEEKGGWCYAGAEASIFEREMAALVEENEELAAKLKHQWELDSVSQKDLDAIYAEYGMMSDDNQRSVSGRWISVRTEGWIHYSAQGLDRKETPLYNYKAKKRLSKLDMEFGGKTPALLEKILEHPMISIDELKVLLTPAGPLSLKPLSGVAPSNF